MRRDGQAKQRSVARRAPRGIKELARHLTAIGRGLHDAAVAAFTVRTSPSPATARPSGAFRNRPEVMTVPVPADDVLVIACVISVIRFLPVSAT